MARQIETTLGHLIVAIGTPQEAGALMRLAAVPLPVQASWHLSKLCGLVDAEAQRFHAERQKHIVALGVAREPTEQERAQGHLDTVIDVTAENMMEFRRRMKELADIPVTIGCGPLDLAGLAIDITAGDVIALGPLCELREPDTTT